MPAAERTTREIESLLPASAVPKAWHERLVQALEQADARRIEMAEDVSKLPENERGGPRKIEPTRYGDWERKGIAYDF